MRIGVYVCHCGGNISEVVDINKVVEAAKLEGDVVLVKDNSHLCSNDGQTLMLNDIKEYKLDKVVVSACSPQFQGLTFMRVMETAGLNPYVLEMANIREQCSWAHYNFPKEATDKAIDLTKIAISKVRLDTPLDSKKMPIGKRVLVVGAGIAGIQASLDLGDAGFKVYLVEKEPSIGGHMAQLSKTFPTEDCSACILSPKMSDVPANKNIELMTYSQVESITGYLGNYEVTVNKRPTYVDPVKCTACGDCVPVCPIDVPDEYNEGLSLRKAIYITSDIAVPHSYVLDTDHCLGLFPLACSKCRDACEADAINYDLYPEKVKFTVDTIIIATGFDIFDAKKKPMFGFGKFENVYNALEMERIIGCEAEGKKLAEVGKKIALIQCVGSRDEQINREYCSRVCCMYATKLAQLMKRSDPKKDISIFYTDMRTYGKGFEEYYKRAQKSGVKYIRGRVAEIEENPDTKKLKLKVEDTLSRSFIESEFDTVVLSVGLEPNKGTETIRDILRISKSSDGFLQEAHPKFRPVDTLIEGVFLAGTVQGPKDIPDAVAQASAAAARAIRLMNQGEYEAEPITAWVDEDICAGCGICVGICPYDAITSEEQSDGTRLAVVNEILCKGCGSCSGACPTGASQQKWFDITQLRAMLEAAL
ncbi:CoB--CoM heterodisulfide reductase iron-sulfur subunit A family protein [bacterium]|nr:CoB--CoM heterodisulfide reductase iron-sulfur subunit A family protein [bacterium]